MWHWLREFVFWPPPRPEVVSAAVAEFAESPAPAWVLEWTGDLLPGGGTYRGRLPCREAGPATASVVYPVRRRIETPPRGVDVDDVAAARLRAVLREAFPDGLLSVAPQCRDGLPIEVTVHRREPALSVRARCNLGDGFGFIPVVESLPWSERAALAVERGVAVPAVFRLGFILLEWSLTEWSHSAQPGEDRRQDGRGDDGPQAGEAPAT